MSAGLWHRVDENKSNQTRKNIFLEYGPSWVVASDRFQSRMDLAEKLNREQQIIMRVDRHPNFHIKPPLEDVPLFDLRECEEDIDSKFYADYVPCHLRKHSTWVERNKLL